MVKNDSRNQTKTNVRQIRKSQHEELLEQGKNKDTEDFLLKITNISGIQVSMQFKA